MVVRSNRQSSIKVESERNMEKTESRIYSISWNITRRCNLQCAHCYLPAHEILGDASYSRSESEKELSTSECFQLIDQIAQINPKALLILTGGEPLLREDIFDISQYASQIGFMVVMGTNGTLINDELAEKMAESDIKGVGISVDSLVPERHDSFRGIKGAWKNAISGIEALKRVGLEFSIQTTVSTENYDEIPQIIEYSHQIGAKVFTLFFLVCTGRGQELTDITPSQYENMLTKLYQIQLKYSKRDSSMLISAKCVPQYRRIVYEFDPNSPLIKTYAGGCPAGIHYCRITPEGNLTPCPYLPLIVGNLREKTFVEIWKSSEVFYQLRASNLTGRCGDCEFQTICSGCRARAYAETQDYLEEDPWCSYKPGKYGYRKIALPKEDTYGLEIQHELEWTEEARMRLNKIPSFAQGMVIKGVERFASEKGYRKITPDVMKEARESLVENRGAVFPFSVNH